MSKCENKKKEGNFLEELESAATTMSDQRLKYFNTVFFDESDDNPLAPLDFFF